MEKHLEFWIQRFQEAVQLKKVEVQVLDAYVIADPENPFFRLQADIKRAELAGLQIHLLRLRHEALAEAAEETKKEPKL